MTKIEWDKTGSRYYETGVKNCVLYPQNATGLYPSGVAWNGITAINESPSGAEASDLWADDMKYATLRSAENFGGTIEAYTYPDEFGACDGTVTVSGVKLGMQSRSAFGLCYRTSVGNDTMTEDDDGYILHLVYGATASPSQRSYATINESPDAITFSWEFATVPVNVTGHKATSIVSINTVKLTTPEAKAALVILEKCLYGDTTTAAYLPLPNEVLKIMDGTQKTPNPPAAG